MTLLSRLALLGVLLVLPAASALEIAPVDPLPGQTVYGATPTLIVAFVNGTADPSTVRLALDDLVFDELPDGTLVNQTGLRLPVPAVFRLAEGNHTLTVTIAELGGAEQTLVLPFVVAHGAPPKESKPLDLGVVVLVTASGLVLLAGMATGGYVYLRRTRNFTFRKHFLRNPGQLKFLTLYIPSGLAILLTLAGLFYVSTLSQAPRYATELVLTGGAALATGPFGLSSLRANLRTRAFERAFAQFLFELADAVRGGINPIKAVQEMAKTGEGILKFPLQQAADALRLGRPMDEALRSMVASIDSPLVTRYAALVGEASSMGGSVAGVLQRAAKDMDDLVKIQGERRRAMRQPVFTMYMAFSVLLIMVLQIISFAPNVGDLDLSALGVGGAGTQVAKMPTDLMQERFFHLLLVNAAGAGLLVGAFTTGRIRNGILHAIVMVGAAASVYPLFTL